MKQYFLIIIITILSAGTVNAQRYLPGQRGIEFSGGFVNGIVFSKKDNRGFYGNISISTYTSKANRWVFGAEYLQKQFEYREKFIPAAQITLEAGHYFKLLSDRSKIFFMSVGPNILAGYESLNWGKKNLYDGASLESKDNFIYGGAISFDLETYLTERIVLLLRARERIIFGSSINRFQFQFGGGIKIMIR